ncbi:MAG TPA: hypothetical protein VFW66_13280, partial [Gemmatimonadales bacterium]|nr:hypothetical protein [Gemmatimonadales bacterium]
MTEHPEPDIRLDVNLRNPGQFFACCGALELASRLWPGTPENGWTSPEGWFAGSGPQKTFEIATHSGTEQPLTVILARLADEEPIVELAEDHEAYAGGDRKPVVLRAPFRLRLDWWLDSYRGADKSELKVWAGQ